MCIFIRHVYNGQRVNPIDFGTQRSKVKVTLVIIVNCWVRGDTKLRVFGLLVDTFHAVSKLYDVAVGFAPVPLI